MTSLQDLPGNAVTLIIRKLPSADRRRLSLCCQRLRRLCADLTGVVAVTQQDLEEWADDALCAFPNVAHLQLVDVVCESTDFAEELSGAAPELLQGLKSLQVTNRAALDAQALLLLASYCPQLTQLSVRGTWSLGSNSSSTSLQDTAKSQGLHSLILQRNTGLSPTQLIGLLSAPSQTQGNRGFVSNSSVEADAEQYACSSGQHHQPLWSQQLQECCWGHVDPECVDRHNSVTQTPAWPSLTELDLSGCTRIGQSLGFLALCPSLQSLSLHSCSHVTDSTLQELKDALNGSSTHPAAVDSDSNTLSAAEACSDAAATAAGDHAADSIPLQQLDLSYTRVKDPGMRHLVSAMPNLCWLSLKGCNVGDDGLQHLLKFQHLTGLHIKHCHRVTEEGIAALHSLSQLRSLSYGYTSMPEADDVVVDIARHFTALAALDLLASELTDTGLVALGELQHLQRLKLYQAGVTAEGLWGLAGQPGGACLRELVLYGTGALRQLVCLGAFPVLQQLQLGRLCDLSAPMADAICDLTAAQCLTSLTLERMDDITPGSLQHIMRGCRELQMLRVRGCDGVCEEDMEDLAADADAACCSSASVWWAAAASVDTDDEEDGWQMLQPV